jgi:excisionase family DNA binding protein
LDRITFTTHEVAAYLGVSKDLIYQMVREKTIPCVRIGRRILFKRDSIDRWFASKEECNFGGE